MTMALSSDTIPSKNVAEGIRDDLLDLPEVSQVNISTFGRLRFQLKSPIYAASVWSNLGPDFEGDFQASSICREEPSN